MPIHKSIIFWTLIAGLLAFVAKFFYPAFPLSEVEILALIIFVLNLFNIKPELQARGLMAKG
jgi:hypothetical protein